MSEIIRIVQYFNLTAAGGPYRYQNYFVGDSKFFGGSTYGFAPFQVNGGVSSLNGDNVQIQVLFPANEIALRLLDVAEGNRKSLLTLYTRTVNKNGQVSNAGPTEQFIGLGASIGLDTVELRFNTAADSVASNFPAQRLNQENVGFLPLDSALSLR
tara:strand:- start:63 stop:530 length:468 start_codon:yes stop_codon:yes gene_type:complete